MSWKDAYKNASLEDILGKNLGLETADSDTSEFADSSQTLVDEIIKKGDDPEYAIEPEDKYALPKQLNTIANLRKKGFDNQRIFKAMELEQAESESTGAIATKAEKDFEKPEIKPATGRKLELTAEKDDMWQRLTKPTKAYFLAGGAKQTLAGALQSLGTVQPGTETSYYSGRTRGITDEQALELTLDNPLFKTGQRLYVSGLEDFASRPDLQPSDSFMDYEWSDPEFIASAIGQALPSFLTYIVPSATVALTTRNPALAFATTMATAYNMEAGSMYNEALESGLTPQEASNVAMTVGTINSMISLIPAGGIFSKLGISNKALNDVFLKGAIRKQLFKNMSTKGFVGASTEMIEEILQETTNIVAETQALGKEFTEEEIVKRLQAVAVGGGALGGTTGIASGGVQTVTDVGDAVAKNVAENLTVQKTAETISNDEANNYNIKVDAENDGSRLLTEKEIKDTGYDVDLNQIPTVENEKGETLYAVKIKGENDNKGNISISGSADRSTLLEEVVEARVKQLRNSKNIQERALADKIEIWAKSVRKKASEMGLELRFSEEGEGNLELFSDAIVYTIGGFKGLDQKFEDAIYVPEDISSEFVGVLGEMSDGSKVFDILKGQEKGIQPNKEFARGVDQEITTQLYQAPQQKRGPPTRKKPLKKASEVSNQLEPDVIDKAVKIFPDVLGLSPKTGKLTPKAGRLNRYLNRLVTKATKANPEQKPIPTEKMVGRPKNKEAVRIELKDGGVVYAGPKTADQWLEQVNSILSEEEQIKASQWYEEAYPAFLEYFGEKDALPYMVGWLMGNVNASPQDALSNLYLGLEQLKAEFPSMKSAGLPGPAKNLKKIFAGERTEEGAGVKLYDFMDSALGKDTRTIMQDDPRAGSAVADDRHTDRDSGFVDATMYDQLLKLAKDPSVLDDVIIDRKRTYKQAVDKDGNLIFNKDGSPKMKGSIAGPTETQYEWTVKSFNEMTAEINKTGYLGGNLRPAQIQAVGWTAIARALQTSEGMSIPDSFKNQEPTIAFELNFGQQTPYGKKFGQAYNELSLDEQQKLTDEIVELIVPELAKDIGLNVLKTSSNVIGGWQGDVSANQTMVVRGSNQAIKGMMNSLGLLLQQDSIASIRMNSSFPGLGLAWYNPALADPNIAGIVYKILEQELDGKLVPGFFMENDFTGEGEGFNVKNEHAMIIGTDIKQSELIQFEDQLENARERINEKLDIDMQFPVAFGQKYEATDNQWEKSTEGESYTDSIVEQFGKPLQKRLNDYYAPRVEKRLRERLLDKRRKQLKSYQIVPDVDLATETDAVNRITTPLDVSEEYNYTGVGNFISDVRSGELKKKSLGKTISRVVFNTLYPIVSLQEDIKEAYLGDGNLREHMDVVLNAELSVGKIPELIKDWNKANIDGKNPDSFVSRLNNDVGIGLDEFSDYLLAKHAKIRNEHLGEDGASGMTNAQAKKLRREINKKYGLKNLNVYVKEFRKTFIDEELKLRFESGLISEADYNNLTDPSVNPIATNYVPLYRLEDDPDRTFDQVAGRSGSGKGFDVKGSEFQKARGSKKRVRNIIINTAERMQSAIIRSEKNKVNRTLLSLVESFPSSAYEVRGQRYKPVYDEFGEIDFMIKAPNGKTADGTRITEENTVHVKVDGKIKQIIFKGQQGLQMARAMKSLNMSDSIEILNNWNTFQRYVNTIANPAFIIPNFVRDLITAGIAISVEQGSAIRNQALSPTNLRNAWKAVYGVSKDGEVNSEWAELYERLRRAGGKTGFFDLETIEDKILKLNTQLKLAESDPGKVTQAGKAITNFIENVNEATETAVRLTLFKAMLENGYSEKKSAMSAKNVTINFNRKGDVGPLLNSLFLFANAGLQGSHRIYTILKTKGKRAQRTAKTIVGGLVVTGFIEAFLNNMASDEDDEYYKLDNWIKDNYYIARYGSGDKYLKLRVPYGFNIFKVAGNIVGDMAWASMGNIPMDLSLNAIRFLNSVANSYSPIGSGPSAQMITPTIADPIVQLSTNTNFYGAPIYPEKMGPAPADAINTWDSTPGVYKKTAEYWFNITGGKMRYDREGNPVGATYGPLGPFGDISPETLKYFVRYLGGGLGGFLANSLETTVNLFSKENELDVNNIPIMRQFFGQFKKDSEARILYRLENEMERQVFSQIERDKYLEYLRQFYEKGNITGNERQRREDAFDKAQKIAGYVSKPSK